MQRRTFSHMSDDELSAFIAKCESTGNLGVAYGYACDEEYVREEETSEDGRRFYPYHIQEEKWC